MSGRLAALAALLGIAVLGATCKGNDAHPPSSGAQDRVAQAAPLVRAPAIGEIEGVDLSLVEPLYRADALRLLNETFCYCGCPRTIAACLANRADCTCVQCSERMAGFILDEYQQGASTEDVEAQLLEGFSEGYNGRALPLDHPDQPAQGDASAPFEIVEFADFRCPHCAAAFEELERLAAKRKDLRVRYYYFPLSFSGELSVRAAEAAEEARLQGKFWEMARKLFANQLSLEEEDLVGYAQEVGLDVPRFQAAMKERKHRDTVMDDKRIGEQAGVVSTPTIFVNGRRFGLSRSLKNFEMRLQMEAERGTCR